MHTAHAFHASEDDQDKNIRQPRNHIPHRHADALFDVDAPRADFRYGPTLTKAEQEQRPRIGGDAVPLCTFDRAAPLRTRIIERLTVRSPIRKDVLASAVKWGSRSEVTAAANALIHAGLIVEQKVRIRGRLALMVSIAAPRATE